MQRSSVFLPITRAAAGVKPLAQSVLNFIYPPRCLACGDDAVIGRGLCGPCFADTHFLSGAACDSCGQALHGRADSIQHCEACRRYPKAWGRAAAALAYTGTGRRIILAFKHGDRVDMAPQLATWLARNGAELLAKADIIAPVPLHWRRTMKRRYNQSAELVRHLPAGPTTTRLYTLLTRPVATISQDGLSRADRKENLRGKITVRPQHAARIKGAHVLLVDDVMTTGATLSAATEACFTAGAASVNVLVVARVAPPE